MMSSLQAHENSLDTLSLQILAPSLYDEETTRSSDRTPSISSKYSLEDLLFSDEDDFNGIDMKVSTPIHCSRFDNDSEEEEEDILLNEPSLELKEQLDDLFEKIMNLRPQTVDIDIQLQEPELPPLYRRVDPEQFAKYNEELEESLLRDEEQRDDFEDSDSDFEIVAIPIPKVKPSITKKKSTRRPRKTQVRVPVITLEEPKEPSPKELKDQFYKQLKASNIDRIYSEKKDGSGSRIYHYLKTKKVLSAPTPCQICKVSTCSQYEMIPVSEMIPDTKTCRRLGNTPSCDICYRCSRSWVENVNFTGFLEALDGPTRLDQRYRLKNPAKSIGLFFTANRTTEHVQVCF